MWRPMQRTALVVAALGTLWLSVGTSGQSTPAPSTSNGEWPHYTADLRGTKASPLDQINASNFNKLEIAWRFKTDSLGTRPEYKLEGTPSWSAACSTRPAARAERLSPSMRRSGELLWVHRYPEGTRAARAATALRARSRVLDRRPRRRPGDLRHAGLPSHRAEREDRRCRSSRSARTASWT